MLTVLMTKNRTFCTTN